MKFMLLLISVLCVVPRARAAEDVLGRKVNGLAAYKVALSDLERTRGQILDKGDGLLLEVQKTNRKLHDLIIKMKASNRESLDALTAGGSFEVFSLKIDEQSMTDAQALSAIRAEFMTKRLAITNALAKLPKTVLDYTIPGFGEQQKQFDNLRLALIDSIQAGLSENDRLYNELEAIQDDIHLAFKKRAQLVLINRNIDQIDSKIAEIDRILKRPLLVAPYVSQIQIALSSYNDASLELDYFRMRRGISELANACKSYMDFVAADSKLNVHSQKEIKVFKRLCDSTPNEFEDLFKNSYESNPNKMIADAVSYYRKPTVESYCQTKNAGKYNCGIFAWAGKLSSEDILKMDEKELNEYEDLWTTILKKNSK